MSPSVAILLTCHNRKKKTAKCLDNVFHQASSDHLNLEVILVDDGSTDGTAEMVKEFYPQVRLLIGDGKLFWNRGMHLAFSEALEKGFDYYIWLNDDTHLHDGAIRALLEMHQSLMEQGEPDSIIMASTRDPFSGELSYGGYRRCSSFNPLSLRQITPTDKLEPCDAFCGNCVLIPSQVAGKVGNIDPVYLHRWGDVDYGLRALGHNCKNWIAPGFLADCEDNPMADRWRDPKLTVGERVKELHSLKGLGKEDWRKFVSRHGGMFWPLIWMRPYLRIVFDTVRDAPKAIVLKMSGH